MTTTEDPGQPRHPIDQPTADAPKGNWVDAHAPQSLKPYLRMMRADRPIGAWLLLIPGWQAIMLAGGDAGWGARGLAIYGWHSILWLFLAFYLGGFVMRGAGCVLNDIVDRDIDAKVERTRSRPLPSGQVSLAGAATLLTLLCAIGLAILLSFNQFAVWVGLASALPIVVYPFMKRITWWPQVFLGIAFSWGALLGWAAMKGDLDWPAALLYAHGIAWTIGYDTIYAHQDREDDALIGVKSTALLFGDNSRRFILICYSAALVFAGAAALTAGLGVWFWAGLAAYALHLLWQVFRLDIDDPALCLSLFKSNRDAGLLLLVAIGLGSI